MNQLIFIGGLGYMKDYPYERYMRDTRIMLIFEGTNEILRLFISLMGIQHAGKELSGVVKKIRNPFLNPGFALKFILQESRHRRDNPSLNLKLSGFVHPSLKLSADQLEYCILRLQYGVRVALQRHGKDVVNAQLELQRLADCAMHIYAAFSSLSRASRSYCIGLHNAEYELNLANAIVIKTQKFVKTQINEIAQGEFGTLDSAYITIGNKVFEKGGYFAAHPLTKNFV
jgi:acyl-CoA dehydrogenase family member 9